MPDFIVSTAFRSKDEMTKTFKKMGLSSNKFASGMVRNFNRVEMKALGLRRIIGGILGAAAIQRSLSLVRMGVQNVATEFLSFEDAVTAAAAKFGLMDRKSEAFKELGKTAREVGATTEFTSAQAAEGLRFLAKAGWEADAALKALPHFVNLATSAELEFGRAADIATDVMGAFGLKSKDAQKNMEQLIRVNDVMAKAVNMSNIDMEDLFETIKFAGPIAKTAGVSLEKFSAMAAFIGGAGIKGSLGGTALRTMFLNLAAPTDKIKEKLASFNTEIKSVGEINKNRKALKKMGIQLTDTKGALRDPVAILRDLKAGFKNLGPAAQAAALKIIFGRRAVSAAAVSVEGAGGGLEDFVTKLEDAGGTSKKMADFMRGSISKRLAELKSTAIEVGFKFIDAFRDDIPGAIDKAVAALRKFDVQKVLDDLGKLADSVSSVLDFIRDYKGVLVGIGVALATIKIGAFIVSMWEMVAVAKALYAAGGIAGMFAGLGGVAAILGPIALAVGGLAAGIYTLVTRWDELATASRWAFEELLEWGQSVKTDFFDNIVIGLMNLTEFFQERWLEVHRLVSGYFGFWSDFLFEMANVFGGAIRTVLEGIGTAIKFLIEQADKLRIALGGDENKTPLKPTLIGDLLDKPSPGGPADVGRPEIPPVVPPAENKNVTAPNQAAVAAAQQNVNFQGRVDFANAPQGTKVTSKTTGAPPIRTELLGSNI